MIIWDYGFGFAFGFRLEKYAKNFPGFEGKDLIPVGFPETPTVNYDCNLFSSVEKIENDFLKVNYSIDYQMITIENFYNKNVKGQLFDAFGKAVFEKELAVGASQIAVNFLPSGVYFYRAFDLKNSRTSTYKFFKL